jgi:hypothetical protein
MSQSNSAPADWVQSAVWIEQNVRNERFLLASRGATQLQRVAELATHLHRVHRGPKLPKHSGPDAERATECLKTGTAAVQTWFIAGAFDSIMGRSLDATARRQAARISNRGAFAGLDEGVVEVMRYVIVSRLSGTATLNGGFIEWGKDTSRELRPILLAKMYGISAECQRAYRKLIGLPEVVRLDAKGAKDEWTSGLAAYFTATDGPVPEFEKAAETTFRWPRREVWNYPTEATKWAMGGWFRGLFNDAGETRPSMAADVHRIARHLGRRDGTDLEPLPVIVNRAESEWTAVVAGCEQLLQELFPKKWERLLQDRTATTRAVEFAVADVDDDDDAQWFELDTDDWSTRDPSDTAERPGTPDDDPRHGVQGGPADGIESGSGGIGEDWIGDESDPAVAGVAAALLELPGAPDLDTQMLAGLLHGFVDIIRDGLEVDVEMVGNRLHSILDDGPNENRDSWLRKLHDRAVRLASRTPTDGDGGQ